MFAWDAGDGGRLSNMDQFDEVRKSSEESFFFVRIIISVNKRGNFNL